MSNNLTELLREYSTEPEDMEKLLAELQKREMVLRETFSRKEAELEQKFAANRARLEKEYNAKLDEVEELKAELRKKQE